VVIRHADCGDADTTKCIQGIETPNLAIVEDVIIGEVYHVDAAQPARLCRVRPYPRTLWCRRATVGQHRLQVQQPHVRPPPDVTDMLERIAAALSAA